MGGSASLLREALEMNATYQIHCPLMEAAQFSFVAVFQEATECIRSYTLPFNMLNVFTHENEEDPSWAELCKTGDRLFMHRNDVSMITCDVPIRCRFTSANKHLCIHFKLELFPGLDVFSGLHRVFIENDPEQAREIQAIFAEPDSVLMLSKCQAFALRFCHRHWPDRYPFDLNRIQSFRPVLDFVRHQADATLEIGELAAMIGRSEGSFTRSFHKVFHQSPKQYLQRELYIRAAQLLLDPGATVKSVAAELKFSSEFYFSRFFKRLSGISPLEYRNNAYSTRKGQKMT